MPDVTPRRVTDRILRFHRGRDPDLLLLKYEAMARDRFAFFRGTCHLFFEDWPRESPLDGAPHAWLCGDLHLENFGAYRGDNRLDYFDLTDFDETVLGPCTWDLARFVTSLFVAGVALEIGRPVARKLGRSFLERYAESLATGRAGWVERQTATGMVGDLLSSLERRNRKALLKKRTVRHGRRRLLRLDGEHALPATAEQRRVVKGWMKKVAAHQSDPAFFRVLDVARRIAGTGSLGVERYVVLVEGRGSPDKNFLLDLKAAAPSALAHLAVHPQPRWGSHADRVVTVQRRLQAVPPALLQEVRIGRRSYILRELQPREDRLELSRGTRAADLAQTVSTMADIVAWAHLRGSGRSGAPPADALMSFAGRRDWRDPVLRYAQQYAEVVESDWLEFRSSGLASSSEQPTR